MPRSVSASASPVRASVMRELPGDRWPAQVGVDQQDALVAAAGQRAGQVDRRHRLAVAGRRAVIAMTFSVARPRQALDREAQPLVLLRRERRRAPSG